MDISIHAPREGRDSRPLKRASRSSNFNPRAPRGARRLGSSWLGALRHFNPRAPRGARRRRFPLADIRARISIHAPREGRDYNPAEALRLPKGLFQSTRPARGATTEIYRIVQDIANISIHAPREGRDRDKRMSPQKITNFNPRAPRGARPRYSGRCKRASGISIHAPREGRDGNFCAGYRKG